MLRLDRIEINGYRKFIQQEISFKQNQTVIAGANNSGKTSLIDLFTILFDHSGKNNKFIPTDFNAEYLTNWVKSFIGNDEISYKNTADPLEDHRFPKITIRITVSYNPETDDISEFAPYLMDLDDEKSQFYFEYQFTIPASKVSAFLTKADEVNEHYKSSQGKANIEADESAEFRKTEILIKEITDVYYERCAEEIYYCDESYNTKIRMDRKEFIKLFRFKTVQATRPVDDANEDRRNTISKLIGVQAKSNRDFSETIRSLPYQFENVLERNNIKEQLLRNAEISINKTIQEYSSTNGGHSDNLDLQLNVGNENIERLVSDGLQANYRLSNGTTLAERSQGLGYSNLIFMHLQKQQFSEGLNIESNKKKVNIFVFEEPESHMHPHMQRTFIKHILSQEEGYQLVLTTHSNEIVRACKLDFLRILRNNNGCTDIIDLANFVDRNLNDAEERRNFELLFSLNFADVVFADKAILYEDDTERMYLQAIITKSPEFEDPNLKIFNVLKNRYISYIQVGGAYAHKYKDLLADTLKIPTIVITDIDYPSNCEISEEENILNSETTNAVLRKLTAQCTVNDIFKKIDDSGLISIGDGSLFALVTQSKLDSLTRTLEEAIIACLFGTEARRKEDWKKLRDAKKISFPIPQQDEEYSFRKILNSDSFKKTEFMQSVVISQDLEKSIPAYIKRALSWLLEQD